MTGSEMGKALMFFIYISLAVIVGFLLIMFIGFYIFQSFGLVLALVYLILVMAGIGYLSSRYETKGIKE